jgi:hypothetical protein
MDLYILVYEPNPFYFSLKDYYLFFTDLFFYIKGYDVKKHKHRSLISVGMSYLFIDTGRTDHSFLWA